MVRLGDVCEIVSGTTPKSSVPEYWDGEINWVTPAELNDGITVIYESQRKITEQAVMDSSLKPFPAGTVLLSSRAPIGKVAISGVEMYCNQGFKNLICSEKIYNKYLFWFLKGKTDFLNSLGRGATFKEISKSIVENIDIPLPPIEDQRRFAVSLDKVNDLISLRKQQLAKLDELVKARFVELFGDPVLNSYGYGVHSLQSLIDEGIITYHLDGNHGGDYPRNEDFVDAGVPYIGANSINNGRIDFRMAKHITVEKASKLRKGLAQNGDVLFAHNATVGPVAILETTEPKVVLSTSLTAYRCNTTAILPRYLAAYMRSDGFIRQYSSEMKQTTRNQVPITAQKKYLFMVAPIDEQGAFEVFAAKIDKQKLTIQQSLDKLEMLKKSLMQEYFG